MRKLISLLIFVCLLVQMSSRLLIIGTFYANREYITTHFCVNKDKPQMKCGGRCYLHKELKENDKKSGNALIHPEKFQEFVFIIPSKFNFPASSLLPSEKAYTLMKANQYSYSFVPDCFRPPAIV